MQMSVPEATDISGESAQTHAAYGTEPGKNSFANNCLLARRLCERGVRFVQLYDWGWDAHGDMESTSLKGGHQRKLKVLDKAVTALLLDLKHRGMLNDTLLVCGAEFGRGWAHSSSVCSSSSAFCRLVMRTGISSRPCPQR